MMGVRHPDNPILGNPHSGLPLKACRQMTRWSFLSWCLEPHGHRSQDPLILQVRLKGFRVQDSIQTPRDTSNLPVNCGVLDRCYTFLRVPPQEQDQQSGFKEKGQVFKDPEQGIAGREAGCRFHTEVLDSLAKGSLKSARQILSLSAGGGGRLGPEGRNAIISTRCPPT